MTYCRRRTKASLFEQIWLFLTLVLTIYIFFFQYTIRSYNGLTIILCSYIILCGGLYIFINKKGRIEKSLMDPIIFFVFAASILTFFFTAKGQYGTDLAVRMLEYVLCAYSIYLLLRNRPEFINILFWGICFSITFLGLFSLIKGVSVTSAGARGIAGLNVNSMSDFFLLMVFCSFYLFWKKQNLIQNMLLVIMNVIVMAAQISAASRRGFIVLVAFWALSLIFALIPFKSNNSSKKKIFLWITLIIAVIVALLYFQKYLLDSTVLGARLLGNYDGGDAARARYQAFAWEQFKEHPIVGIGLGGVAYHMGAYSHSMFYELFSCTGIILACIFLVGLFHFGFSYWRMNKLYRKAKLNKEIVYVTAECLIFWLCLVVSGYAVVMIYDYNFYFSIALLAAIYKNIKINGVNVYSQLKV